MQTINRRYLQITIVIVFLWGITTGVCAQQSCYQIGLNEGMEIYNAAQRLERSGRCIDAVPQYWEAIQRFRLTRSCRDIPPNHELGAWEDRCVTGITTCGGKYNETTVLTGSARTLKFTEDGGEQFVTVYTNADTWSVESNPSWCTVRKSNNRLIINCNEHIATNSLNGRLIISANTLTFEIAIEQAGKPPVDTPAITSMKTADLEVIPVLVPPPPAKIHIITKPIYIKPITVSKLPQSSTPSASRSYSIKLKAGVGIKAGLNLTTISNANTNIKFTPELKPDFHAGVFADLNFSLKENKRGILSLQPELLYSRQGFASGDYTVNFDYITGLLLFKLRVFQPVSFELGPWSGYLLSVNPDSMVINEKNIKLSDLKGGKDVGVAAGIAVDFNFGLIADVRYLYGFSDMANNLWWTNNVIAVSFGWKFKI